MKRQGRVVVLGGGMAGMGAASALATAGCDVTIVEQAAELGGLAGSFEQAGAFYPIGYHHILATDRTVRRFLRIVGAEGRVRWRRVPVLFWFGGELHNLGTVRGMARFPLSVSAKLRFVALMVRAFLNRDWSSWEDRSAAELIDRWGGQELRSRLFEPLAKLKFRASLSELSAAWMGARLHAREGASRLGYIPDTNWTKVLCDGLTEHLRRAGCSIRVGTAVERARVQRGRVLEVKLSDGSTLAADAVVSTLPTAVHRRVMPEDETEELTKIRYTALISAISASRQAIRPSFYWLNLTSLDRTACAIFQLSELNPTIGHAGESVLNFVTHLAGSHDELFRLPDEELIRRYREDARAVLGLDLEMDWVRISRVKHYSPIFERGYRNPPVRSRNIENLYFAGNFRTHPAVASTGTALESGLSAAAAALADPGSRLAAGVLPSRRPA